MILYKDNPNLKLKVITTARGDREYRVNCQNIKDGYYLRDRDCFKFNGKWFRFDSGYIAYDSEKKVWMLKQSEEFLSLIEGVVEVKEDGTTVKGYFSKNVYNNCTVNDEHGRQYPCLSVDILRDSGFFVERLTGGQWFHKNNLDRASTADFRKIQRANFQNKGYNIEDNSSEYDRKKYFFEKYPHEFTKDVRAYAKLLGETTFGLECETSAGDIPEWEQNRLGIVACRDGSVSGAEWVTVPMSGAKGLQNILNLSKTLTEKTNIDVRCSLHIHIGNIPTDRTYMTALYMLCYAIQDDVFKMFPYYKTDPTGIKEKNWCQKLKKQAIHPLKEFTKEGYNQYIKTVYDKLFYFLSDGHMASQEVNRKIAVHPVSRKWDRPSRRYWINLQNMIFSERQTAEFRIKCSPLY